MSETKTTLPPILMALSRAGSTMFRQNVGTGWLGRGKPVRITKRASVQLNPGDMVLRGPVRPLHAGLVKGSSDLIGWTPVEITPDMVGQTIAVFTGVEVKGPKTRTAPEQVTFRDNVLKAGGFAGITRTVEEALAVIRRN